MSIYEVRRNKEPQMSPNMIQYWKEEIEKREDEGYLDISLGEVYDLVKDLLEVIKEQADQIDELTRQSDLPEN